jgi:hypothetical protein
MDDNYCLAIITNAIYYGSYVLCSVSEMFTFSVLVLQLAYVTSSKLSSFTNTSLPRYELINCEVKYNVLVHKFMSTIFYAYAA